MSVVPLKPFTELSNFQQWAIFYILKNGRINVDVEKEITNFCDTTKQSIDLNKYDEDMSNLQKELVYLAQAKLIESIEPNYYSLSTKGNLYCYQNLEELLAKLGTSSVRHKIVTSEIYNKSKVFFDRIFRVTTNLQSLATVIIEDKRTAMRNIIIFAQLLILLLSL